MQLKALCSLMLAASAAAKLSGDELRHGPRVAAGAPVGALGLKGLPVTAGADSAWKVSAAGATCDPQRGIQYLKTDEENAADFQMGHQMALYYTAAGDFAGVRATMYVRDLENDGTPRAAGDRSEKWSDFGALPPALIEAGLYVKEDVEPIRLKDTKWYQFVKERGDDVDEDGLYSVYTLHVATRGPEAMCDETRSSDGTVGDRLVVNPHTVAWALPLTTAQAEADAWHAGSCFNNMGLHYFRPLNGELGAEPNAGGWISPDNLFPVSVMYDEDGDAATFFIMSAAPQQSDASSVISAAGSLGYDLKVFTGADLCANMCMSNGEPGVDPCATGLAANGDVFYSTMHVYMGDAGSVQCPMGEDTGSCIVYANTIADLELACCLGTEDLHEPYNYAQAKENVKNEGSLREDGNKLPSAASTPLVSAAALLALASLAF